MPKRYIVKIKGEFEETQAVLAENPEEAKDKAKRILGETLSRTAIGDPEVLGLREMESRE